MRYIYARSMITKSCLQVLIQMIEVFFPIDIPPVKSLKRVNICDVFRTPSFTGHEEAISSESDCSK